MAVFIAPELHAGVATSRVTSTLTESAPEDVRLTGWRFDFGVRAGAEIHFGFMGLPNLALQGTVGLFVTRQVAIASASGNTLTDGSTQLSTTSFDNPWDFFRGNVAARYYF
jgi:hypothetical protein